jgi:DNA-binding XRE family transcriptional regulator
METGHGAAGSVHEIPVYPRPRRGMTPLRQVRLLSGMRQSDVAAAAGVARQTVSLLEAGSRNPHLSTAAAISRVLGTTIEAIFPELLDA